MLQIQVLCQYCHKPAKLKKGADLFPDYPEFANSNYWVCAPCRARVGCHEGTETPLGSLADGKLRAVRKMGHEAFDPIWKFMVNLKGGKPHDFRQRMYGWLADELGIPVKDCQFGGMPYEKCLLAVKRCNELRMELEAKYKSSISTKPYAIEIPPDLREEVPF